MSFREKLRDSLIAQFGEVIGPMILEHPERFSPAHVSEMESAAQPFIAAALRESYIDLITGREPRES